MEKPPRLKYRVRVDGVQAPPTQLGQPAPLTISHYVEFEIDENAVGPVEILRSEEGQQFRCPSAVEGSVKVYSGRERESGKDKITVQSPAVGKAGAPFPRDHLKARFDYLASIDTNDDEFGGRKMSVASSYCSTASIKSSDTIEFRRMPAFIITDVRKSLNSEIVGWAHFLQLSLPALNLPSDAKLGLIVDSELGRLAAINERTEPYYRDVFLPKNVELIYASGDTGTDLPNKILRQCDSDSKRLMREIKQGRFEVPIEIGTKTQDYSGACRIFFDKAT